MAGQLFLVQFIKVRILVQQPTHFHSPSSAYGAAWDNIARMKRRGMIIVLLAVVTTGAMAQQAEQGDRTERFERATFKPARIAIPKGGAPEVEFRTKGVRRFGQDTTITFQPGYSYSTRSTGWGLTLLSNTTPRARYFYVDRETGKPLDSNAKPTDDPKETRYFDGTAAGSTLFMASRTHTHTRTGFNFDRWSGLGSVQLNSDDDQFQVSASLFGSQTIHEETFWSASLDFTDGKSIPNVALTYTPSFNWVRAPGDYKDSGWTHDLTADASFDLGLPRPLVLTAGYTFPSRFSGDFDYYLRLAYRLTNGPQIRVKLAKDNIYSVEAVMRFTLR